MATDAASVPSGTPAAPPRTLALPDAPAGRHVSTADPGPTDPGRWATDHGRDR